MKIVESITPVNADKTFIGKQTVDLTLDTEDGTIAIDRPAMFTNPIVKLQDLQLAVEKLDNLYQNT